MASWANLYFSDKLLAIIARGKFWVNNHAHILKPKTGNIEYMAGVLEGINYQPWISGAAQPKLTKDRLLAISIPVPSEVEQDNIMAYVQETTASIVSAIDRTHREIDLIREYRTRLIADVVTGKVDVRAAADRLPVEDVEDVEGEDEDDIEDGQEEMGEVEVEEDD